MMTAGTGGHHENFCRRRLFDEGDGDTGAHGVDELDAARQHLLQV